jgi:hypothetical protein
MSDFWCGNCKEYQGCVGCCVCYRKDLIAKIDAIIHSIDTAEDATGYVDCGVFAQQLEELKEEI